MSDQFVERHNRSTVSRYKGAMIIAGAVAGILVGWGLCGLDAHLTGRSGSGNGLYEVGAVLVGIAEFALVFGVLLFAGEIIQDAIWRRRKKEKGQ